MSYQRWRQPRGDFKQDIGTLAVGIVIIAIIGYFLFHGYLDNITNPTLSAVNSNNVNLPSSSNGTNDTGLSNDSAQISQNGNLTMNVGNENNALASGYWILYVSDGVSKQLSINAQDYAFLQTLIQSDDNKGSSTVTLFLIDNGLIHQYNVSKEIYSIISNIAAIKARSSNDAANSSNSSNSYNSSSASGTSSDSSSSSSSSNSSNSSSASSNPSTSQTAETISESLKVSNPSTTGFTVTLTPALKGLSSNNFTLLNSAGNSIPISGVTTSDNGTTYVISAALSTGQTYTITATYSGYTFGAAQNVATQ